MDDDGSIFPKADPHPEGETHTQMSSFGITLSSGWSGKRGEGSSSKYSNTIQNIPKPPHLWKDNDVKALNASFSLRNRLQRVSKVDMTVNNLISEALTPNAGITATESPHLAGTAFVFLVTHQSKQSWWFRVASASLRQGPSGHLRGASAERGKFTQRCDNKHR